MSKTLGLIVAGTMVLAACAPAEEAIVAYETPTPTPTAEALLGPTELLIAKTMLINPTDGTLEFYVEGIAYRSFIPKGGILETLFTSTDQGDVNLDQPFETHPTGYTLSPYHLLKVLRADGTTDDYTTTPGSFAITYADEELNQVVYIIEVANDRTAVEVGRVVNPANDLVLP